MHLAAAMVAEFLSVNRVAKISGFDTAECVQVLSSKHASPY